MKIALIMIFALISLAGCEKENVQKTAQTDCLEQSNSANKEIKSCADSLTQLRYSLKQLNDSLIRIKYNLVLLKNTLEHSKDSANFKKISCDKVPNACEKTYTSRFDGKEPNADYGIGLTSSGPVETPFYEFFPESSIKQIEAIDEVKMSSCFRLDPNSDLYYQTVILESNTMCLSYDVFYNKFLRLDYFRTEDIKFPMLNGKLRIGMTWKDFLNATELNKFHPDIKYVEGYIKVYLEDREINFYFENEILKEAEFNNTHY